MKRISLLILLLSIALYSQTELNQGELTSVPNDLNLNLLIAGTSIDDYGDSSRVSFLIGNPHNLVVERLVITFSDSTGNLTAFGMSTEIKSGYWESVRCLLPTPKGKLYIRIGINKISMADRKGR